MEIEVGKENPQGAAPWRAVEDVARSLGSAQERRKKVLEAKPLRPVPKLHCRVIRLCTPGLHVQQKSPCDW